MKNSILLTSLLVLFSFTSLQAQWWSTNTIQGNGEVTTINVQTANYDGLSVAGKFYVTIVEGRTGNITLTGESNLLEEVIVEVKDNVLHIKTENKTNLKPSRGKKIELTVPASRLSKIALAGSGEIKNNFNLKSDALSVKLAGSGDIKLNLEVTDLESKVAGSGDIILNGLASNLNGSIAGSGAVDAYRLNAGNVSISVAGSGDYKVNCSGDFKGRVSGSGSISYKGKPTKIDSKVAGSGKIKMVD
tara:strand:+ start:10028 stop:10765 length:738 start_codon:yes stop_codon:yes gene_type:complete